MDRIVRRKLEVAAHVLNFCRAVPADAGCATIVARLTELLARAEATAIGEKTARNGARAALARRAQMRTLLRRDVLPHLIRVGRLAAREQPGLDGHLELACRTRTHSEFLQRVRQILSHAESGREILVRHGLAESYLGEFRRFVEELEAVTEAGRAHRLAHIGARAQLKVLAQEVLEVVGVFEGFCRFRFRDDTAVLAEWLTARRGLGPFRPRRPKGPPEATDGLGAAEGVV